MMNDFAAYVLMELEKLMLSASLSMISVATWLDGTEFAMPVTALQDVHKRLMLD